MAYLLLQPTVTKASTICGYESHVKYAFKEEGCPEWEWDTLFLKQIRKGLRNTLPSHADMRLPLLLPSLISQPEFNTVGSKTERILRFATILGFIGMLRPNALRQLSPRSFTIVTAYGKSIEMPAQPNHFRAELIRLRRHEHIVGFYVRFRSKTMRTATAFFPSLCVLDANLKVSKMCPVRAVCDLSNRRILKKGFLKSLNRKRSMTKYLQRLTGTNQKIAPYALRIGGRTWLLTNGMDRQFVDFLGTWKSPEASARYFRAAPREVLLMLQRFYLTKAHIS